MKLRHNRLRELISAGLGLLGAHAIFEDPAYVEFLGHCGFDWVFIDGEHLGTSVQVCYQLVRAADVMGMGSIVRVPTTDVHSHLAYAETGVNALMTPHLLDGAQATSLFDALRFPPAGVRGISTNSRAAGYGFGHTARQYLEDTSEAVIVAAMIEDEEAIKNIEEIIATGSVELYFLGLSDIAGSMGIPGQTDDARVTAAYKEAVCALRQADQAFIAPAANSGAAKQARNDGAALILASTPKIVGDTLSQFVESCRER